MITIIGGTNRPDNKSIKIARVCERIYRDLQQDVQVLSLEQLPHDFAYNDAYGKRTPEMAAIIEQYIEPADRLVIVAAEYNGSYPGVLKAMFDAVHPKYWRGKKAALIGISSGRSGNVRGLEHLTGVLHYLQIEVLSVKPVISSIEAMMVADALVDEEANAVLMQQAQRFLIF